jgi:hypothetical protein
MKLASLSLVLSMFALPIVIAHASTPASSPIVVNGSVVGASGTWTETLPAVQMTSALSEQTTLSIIYSSSTAAGVQPLTTTAWGSETVTFTNSLGTSMYTISILEVNYTPGGTISGVGPCNSSTCSGGYVANGEALCAGPSNSVGGAGSTIGYGQEVMGGAAGFLIDQGIAAYPLVQYNSYADQWTFANPDSSSWGFAGVQCSGWSFSFPSP